MKFVKISAAAVGSVAMPVELWIDRLPPGTGHRCAFRWITKDYKEAMRDVAELYSALEFFNGDFANGTNSQRLGAAGAQ